MSGLKHVKKERIGSKRDQKSPEKKVKKSVQEINTGIEEMKIYLNEILSDNVLGISYLLGIRSKEYEEFRVKFLEKTQVTEEKLKFYVFGRLRAVIDLLIAYMDLKKMSTNKDTEGSPIANSYIF